MVKNIAGYEGLLGTTLKDLSTHWSQEDLALRDWINQCPAVQVVGLLEILKERWNNDVCTDTFFAEISPRYPDSLSKVDITVASTIIVHELREYSKRTFSDGVAYEKTLSKAHKRFGKHYKKPVPEAATIEAREEAIMMMLFGEAVDSLSPKDLQSALSGIEFDSSLRAEQMKPVIIQTIGAGGATALVQILGKNVFKRSVLHVLNKFMQNKIGEKATAEVVKKIGKQIAAQTVKRAAFWIGIAFLVKDIWDLSGEATRITTPLVAGIAVGRTVDRLSASEPKKKRKVKVD